LHIFWTVLLGAIAFLWLAETIEITVGFRSIPRLQDISPMPDAGCPEISILFAARDEAEKLPGALDTLLSLDYPRYEVVGVDDRSEDATGATLEAAARKDTRLKAVHVAGLPAGWLGKPHALQQGYKHSSGEWLVFTDADVHFAPDVLRRSVALAEQKQWEHLTLMASVKMFTAGEKVVMTFFGMAFVVGTRPWRTNNQKSAGYTGVGAFQMIRRSAYEKLGTHRRLAMEVIDDMKLGKLAKEAGVHSGIAIAGDHVSVHWHAGVRNTIRGTTKNFFAASGYRLWLACIHVFGLLLMSVLPFVALPFVRGWPLLFASIAAGLAIAMQSAVSLEAGVSPLYALTHPLGGLIFAWMIMRSTAVTLWQGGIVWRGTFYPLAELKRGVV
jgi:glycosyltransferase involved in cell wall biosynthesis